MTQLPSPRRRADGARAAGRIETADPILRILLVFLALVFVALLAARSLAAEQATPAMRLSEVHAGSLLLRTDQPGAYRPAPMVKTDVRMDVAGTIARVTVSQRFDNPSDDWVEGVYAFPLPENAAVDRLRMQIGDRFIEGKVKEREEARKVYEQARREGRKASLIEEERPNLFTNSVANIGPRETVLIQIEYQQTVRFDQGVFALRFPLVVAPRYIPGGERIVAMTGGGPIVSDDVLDAGRITPPVLHPSAGKVNPVTLSVALDAGMPLDWVRSPSHRIEATRDDAGRQTATIEGGTFADKDFVLEWRPATGAAPAATLFRETIGGDSYLLLTVVPPLEAAAPARRLPREVIYVIDTSGSMSGPSIRQARDALRLALGRLAPEDRFNIVRFSNAASALFRSARPATREALDRAQAFVDMLEAEGGTEMLPALKLALADPADETRLRQVVFLTDGSIGNEAQLFAYIRQALGTTRLFTVGIGSAPNGYFMTKAAELGRGTYTYIGRIDEVADKMTALFQKIEEPVVTDLEVRIASGAAEMWPQRLADLYRGEPVVAAVKLPSAQAESGTVAIGGVRMGERWSVSLPLAEARPGKGVAALWGRRKIDALMNGLHEGVERETVRRDVIEVALAHHLVSAFTSLVAVDVTPSRPADARLDTRDVPLNLPEGWNFEKVFGESAKPVPSPLRKAMLDAAPAAAGSGPTLNQLPQGATPATLKVITGLLSILLALGLLWWFRRRTA